jgi:cysteine synthase
VDVRDGFTDAVGNTPLIRLRKASELTGCNVLGKAEFLNPGGSVKDRAAKYMILDAEERGDLQPGGVVVEGTAGNTGSGLALVGNARGYRTVILMPETQSQEKKDMLRLCGVELRCVPAVPYKDPNHYVKQAERYAAELAKSEPNGVLYANQWDNPSNRTGHVRSTGPEIWAQTGGKSTGFTCAIGTGGTLAGVGEFLKSVNPACGSCRRSDGRRDVPLDQARRAQERRQLDHRGDRPGSRHRQHRGRSDRRRLSDLGRGVAADHLRSAPARGPVPRRLERSQRRRCDPPREGARSRDTRW